MAATDARYQAAFDAMMADLSDPEKSFQFVQEAIRLGDFRGAIAALERILRINPNLANIKLELGILYLRAGANDLAQTYISEALNAHDMPDDVRERAVAYLERAQAAAARHRFNGRVLAGARYESNANAAPPGNEVRFAASPTGIGLLDDENTEQSDLSLLLSTTLQHRYSFDVQSGDELESNLLLYLSDYAEQNDIDVRVGVLEVGPRYYVGYADPASSSFRPFLTARYIELDRHRYLGSLGGGFNFERSWSERTLASVTIEVASETFYNSGKRPTAKDKSGTSFSIDGRLSYQWTPRTVLSGSLVVATKNANQGFESFDEARVSLAAGRTHGAPLALTRRAWRSSVAVSFGLSHYDESDPVIDPLQKRRDDEYAVTLGTEIPVAEHVTLSLTGQYVKRESSLPNFEYDNQAYTMGLSYRF